jgi:hypothetical protein
MRSLILFIGLLQVSAFAATPQLQVSSSGQIALFTVNNRQEVWTRNFKTKSLHRIFTIASGHRIDFVQLSADGHYVVVDTSQTGDDFGSSHVEVINLNDQGERKSKQVVYSASGTGALAWSNGSPAFFDNNKVVYITEDSKTGVDALWVYEAATGQNQKIQEGFYIMPSYDTNFENGFPQTAGMNHHFLFQSTCIDKPNCPAAEYVLELENLSTYCLDCLFQDPTPEGQLGYFVADEMAETDWVTYTRCEGPDGMIFYSYNLKTSASLKMWNDPGIKCGYGGTNFAAVVGQRMFFGLFDSKSTSGVGDGVFDLGTQTSFGDVGEVALPNADASQVIQWNQKLRQPEILNLQDMTTQLAIPQLPQGETTLPMLIGILWNNSQTVAYSSKDLGKGFKEYSIWKISWDKSVAPVLLAQMTDADDFACSIHSQDQSLICIGTANSTTEPAGFWQTAL